jgi:hypothetical protein
MPFVPPPAQQIDPLSGQPIGGHPTGPAALPVFQQPMPPPQSTDPDHLTGGHPIG